MSHLERRGFTLVELVVALLLLGIITAAIYRVLVNNQRIYQAQTQRIDLQQNIRAAATILPAEFRELNATDGDIKAMSATSVTVRAMRQLAVTCVPPVLGGASTAGLVMTVREGLFFGTRQFAVGDSLLVFYEGSDTTRSDDNWALAGVTAVIPATCADGRPGQRLTVTFINVPSLGLPNVAGAVPSGAPVRGFAIVTYRLYQSTDGRWYVGLETPSAAVQPLIGPVTASGLSFVYYNAAGAVTAAPTAVVEIEIRVRGETAQPVRGTDGAFKAQVDSVVTRAALRNNRRF